MAAATQQEAHQALLSHPHIFLQPTSALHSSFLHLAKAYLDPLANNVTDAQLARQKSQRQDKKRKRGVNDDEERIELLRMKKVHVDGFEVDQVWQQARRVLDAATKEVEREVLEDDEDEDDDDVEERPASRNVHFDEGSEELDESEDGEDLGEEGVDYEVEGEDIDDEDEEMDVNDEDEGEDMEAIASDEESLDIGDMTGESEIDDDGQAQETYIKDPNNLNDGFFSIDDFNKQSQFLEQQDFRGEDDGAASDEEDIDWGTDPFAFGVQSGTTAGKITTQNKRASKQTPAIDADQDESDEEDGPTFGNMALNGPEGDSDIEDLEMNDAESINSDDMGAGDTGNANNIMYTDFFAPPARSASKKSKKTSTHESRRKPGYYSNLATEQDTAASQPSNSNSNDAEIAAVQRTMSAVQRDLFNEEDASADEDLDEELSPDEYDTLAATSAAANQRPARQNLSTHEKRQLALRSEIRRLESEAVAAKPWYLNGESLAASRPENALLEEDLEFERAGKPVPVITEETNEDILALIKRRILSREFDEVPRRRPGEADLPGGARAKRGKAEDVSTTKATKGLAEEYEDDLLRRTDPNYVDARTDALKAQHAEIEGLWKHVSAQLDALSNWHYKPRPAGASLEVRGDVAAVAMEDARPSMAGGGDVDARVLAPQEVFKPGEEQGAEGDGVVRTKGGAAVSKEEMSREQKVRRRRREKERARKAGANEVGAAVSSQSNVVGDVSSAKGKKGGNKAEERRDVQAQLKKGGARIIDTKGTIRDVEGNVAKESASGAGGRSGVGALRL